MEQLAKKKKIFFRKNLRVNFLRRHSLILLKTSDTFLLHFFSIVFHMCLFYELNVASFTETVFQDII